MALFGLLEWVHQNTARYVLFSWKASWRQKFRRSFRIFLLQILSWEYRVCWAALHHLLVEAGSMTSLFLCVQWLSQVWFCDSVDCSIPGFSVLHYLPEFAQTHVHWVGDVIQPSHPLSPPSPPDFNLSQHQDLYQWVGFLHQVRWYQNSTIQLSV